MRVSPPGLTDAGITVQALSTTTPCADESDLCGWRQAHAYMHLQNKTVLFYTYHPKYKATEAYNLLAWRAC